MNVWKFTLVISVGSLLAACGGSSGSDSDGVVVPPPVLVKITEDNAREVSSDVLNAAVFSVEMGQIGSFVTVGAEPYPTVNSKAPLLARALSAKVLAQPAMAPVGPETFPCGSSGSVTVSGDLASQDTYTVGDTLSMVFALCDDGFEVVIDGQITMEVTAVSGDISSGLFTLGMDLDIVEFTVDDGGDAGTLDGDLSLLIDTLDYPVSTLEVSGDSLVASAASGRSLGLENYLSTQVMDQGQVPALYTLSSSGTVWGNRYDGEVSFETEVAFAWTEDGSPTQGRMLIEGENSSITITALSSGTLRLEMDFNGDGTVDQTQELTWDEASS